MNDVNDFTEIVHLRGVVAEQRDELAEWKARARKQRQAMLTALLAEDEYEARVALAAALGLDPDATDVIDRAEEMRGAR